ncbi:MAG: hypothetical protein HYR84_04550 [Planctomycetes bacterium]|nr:hypothetical protein [Planctomycetota bacterium]
MTPRWLCTLGLFVLILPAAGAQDAKDAKNPLRFVPKQAEMVIQVDRPRALLDAIEKNETFLQAQKLPGVRDYYDSTNVRQLYQLIAYFEKQLDQDRYDLLDDLTAGGVVVGAKLTQPGGAVLVIQSGDEKKLRRFLDVGLDVVQKELERQESKDKLVRSKYQGLDVGQVGPKVRFAIVDGAFLVGSDEKVLKLALDAHIKKDGSVLQHPRFAEAKKKAPGKALAWGWINLDEVRANNPEFKNGLDAAGLDPFQMLLFGGFADLLKRTPYVAASLSRDQGEAYRVGIAMPVGRDGMAPLKHMILPAERGGTLPTLQPPRVVSSSSYFLDLGELWDKRVEILGPKNAAGLEDGDKNLAKFLGGIKLAKLFKAMGPHHRLVFAQQKERPYKVKPAAPFPAVALVVDMRDPSFAKDMNSIFRAGALLATFQVGLTLKEETYKGCDMVSYYFSETKKFDGDPTGTRFNFSPTYVAVGDQFVMSGTAELARDLIDLLKAEQKQKSSPASMRTALYSSGLGEIIRMNQDQTLTQLILSYALPPKTASEELRRILDWVDQLGTVRLESTYGASDFRYDILWQPKKR